MITEQGSEMEFWELLKNDFILFLKAGPEREEKNGKWF